MPTVLITDNLSAAGLRYLESAGLKVDIRSGLKPLEVREALKEADGIIIRSGTTLTEELLKDQPRLKVIVRAGVGVDNIDLPAATREGIVVMNTPREIRQAPPSTRSQCSWPCRATSLPRAPA